MVFPWWLNKNDFLHSPVTIAMLCLSLFFLVVLPPNTEKTFGLIQEQMNSENFTKVQSFEYQNYLRKFNPEQFALHKQVWFGREQDAKKINLYWTQLSFRDGEFAKNLKNLEAYPDKILYKNWLAVWDRFLLQQNLQWTTFFGLSVLGQSWTRYITYQFIHSGLFHFFSNMILLLLFGFAVEGLFGGVTVAIVYLFSGVTGALYYELVNGVSTAPLIGASASVSGLIAFYFIGEARRNLRFFYFFAPIDGFYGEIFLAKEWLVPMMFLNDINEVFSTPDWLLSIAHNAHLGAVGCGLLLGLIWKLLKARPQVAYFVWH